MDQSTTQKMFEISIQRIDEFRESALQNWTRSGNGRSHLVSLVRVEAQTFAHSIDLNGNEISVQRCATVGFEAGPIFKEELRDGITQDEVDKVVFDLLRKSLGPIEAFMLFDQPR